MEGEPGRRVSRGGKDRRGRAVIFHIEVTSANKKMYDDEFDSLHAMKNSSFHYQFVCYYAGSLSSSTSHGS